MNKYDIGFRLLLCWEPLFVSIIASELELTYLGSEEWDILGADDVLFHRGHFLSASRWVWWVRHLCVAISDWVVKVERRNQWRQHSRSIY
jgi:hypothetical protein